MSQNKKLMQLVISAVLALAFVNFYLKAREQNIESSYGMVDVVSALRDIPPHTQITAAFLTTKSVPLKFVEPGAYRIKIPGHGFDRVIGKITDGAISAGAQITSVNLNDPALEKHGVKKFEPMGERFDPHCHQAMFELPDPSLPVGTVARVEHQVHHGRSVRAGQPGD